MGCFFVVHVCCNTTTVLKCVHPLWNKQAHTAHLKPTKVSQQNGVVAEKEICVYKCHVQNIRSFSENDGIKKKLTSIFLLSSPIFLFFFLFTIKILKRPMNLMRFEAEMSHFVTSPVFLLAHCKMRKLENTQRNFRIPSICKRSASLKLPLIIMHHAIINILSLISFYPDMTLRF